MFRLRATVPNANSFRIPHGAIWAVAFLCGIGFGAHYSTAASEKKILGECRSDFNRWKSRGGFGAFALAANGWCGSSWNAESLQIAKDMALSSCRNGGKGKGCVVIRENNIVGAYRTNWNHCIADGADSIATCTTLIMSGKLKKRDLASAYNNRGVGYYMKNDIEHAIEDFSKSIQIDNSFGWAYSNRARREFDLGDYESALADFRKGQKYYRKGGGDDYRVVDQDLMLKITNSFSSIKNATNSNLCNLALIPSRQDWDTTLRYSRHVKEARRRGLDPAACRAILPATNLVADPPVLDDAPSLTTENLCRMSLTYTKSDWDNSTPRNRFYVAEAIKRGLTVIACRNALGIGN
jgi:tetratricopeptide (TPR) repeat protein